MDQPQAPSNSAIKLKIDTLTGKQFHIFSSSILILLGVVFFLASYAPEGYSIEVRPIVSCSEFTYNIPGYSCADYDAQTNPIFGVEVIDIGRRDQFLALELSPLQTSSHEDIEVPVQVKVNAYALQPQDSIGAHIEEKTTDIVFECSFSQKELCNVEEIYNIPNIEAKGYYFTVTFVNNKDITSQIGDFQVTTKSLNIGFRNYRFIVKLICIALTILTILLHMCKMSNIMKELFTQEQKVLQFITPLLLVINEPFSVFLFKGVLYSWTTVFAFAMFSSLLVWLWLVVIDSLAGSDSSLIDRTSTFAKVYVPIYFVTLFITYGALGHCALHDPLFDFYSGQNLFFKVAKFILFGVLVTGLFWIIAKTYRITKRMNDLTEREHTFFWFSLFFIISHFYFVFRGNLYPFSYNSTGLVLFSGISTLYVFASSYLFLPTEEGIIQANYLRKYNIKNKAVKNSYKDLEESVVHPPKVEGKDTQQTDRRNEDKAQVGVELAPTPEQHYPYEKKGDEDF